MVQSSESLTVLPANKRIELSERKGAQAMSVIAREIFGFDLQSASLDSNQ